MMSVIEKELLQKTATTGRQPVDVRLYSKDNI